MANPKGNPESLRPVRSKDEARKRGAAGGKASGITRRNKRDAKNAISLLLGMAASGKFEKNLRTLGYDEADMTNMNALVARMFVEAMGGDIMAFKALMEYGGFRPDQKLKDAERKARTQALKGQDRDSSSHSRAAAPSGDIDLSALSDKELGDLERLFEKLYPE